MHGRRWTSAAATRHSARSTAIRPRALAARSNQWPKHSPRVRAPAGRRALRVAAPPRRQTPGASSGPICVAAVAAVEWTWVGAQLCRKVHTWAGCCIPPHSQRPPTHAGACRCKQQLTPDRRVHETHPPMQGVALVVPPHLCPLQLGPQRRQLLGMLLPAGGQLLGMALGLQVHQPNGSGAGGKHSCAYLNRAETTMMTYSIYRP